MNFRIGRVATTNGHDNSVNVVMTDDGSRLAGLQVMNGDGSSNTGTMDLTTPAVPPSGNVWDLTQPTGRDVLAIVGMTAGKPFVLGFLTPQVCQMTFKDGRRIQRHASDVYESTDLAGNHEHYHPSGTFVRIGTSPAHEDLTGQDFDKQWAIEANTSSAVYWHLHVSNAGAPKADIQVDPSGNLTVTSLAGGATITFPGGVTIVANVAIQGNLTATGEVIAGLGGGDQVGLQTHAHSDAGGIGDSGPPVPGS